MGLTLIDRARYGFGNLPNSCGLSGSAAPDRRM